MSRSLRSSLSWLAAGAAALGAITLTALIVITTLLNLVARDLETDVESVRIAGNIENQLYILHGTTNPVARGTAMAELLSAVEESSRFANSAEEQRRILELTDAVGAFLRSGAGDVEMARALSATQRVSRMNIDQARQAQERAARWKQAATIGGVTAAALHLVGVVLFFLWLKKGPLQRIQALSSAMDRFHAGDLDARAPEQGPTELVTMARSFNTAASALVRARRRQSEYVATAINELRTPLTAIQLAVSYLTSGRSLPPERRIRDLVKLIARQLTRVNGLTGDILNATWLEEEGTLTLICKHFDLRDLVSEAANLFRGLAPQHLIEVELPPVPQPYYGDRERLFQVLNNLLSNAVKYSPPGSRVNVRLSPSEERFALSVTDEGPGIPPEDREHIFETFRRHSATHEEAPGTSLGLWVARRVVEAHSGQMELESRLGEGSTFYICLPVRRVSAEITPVSQTGTA